MSDPIEFNVSLNEPVNFNLEVGDQGPKGDKGDTGSKGDTGDRGEKGDPGTTDYNQLQNKPQLDIYLKKSEANTTTADLLNKISQNTNSINDAKNSLRNYALVSDVDGRVSDTEARVNNKITQAETRVNNTIGQAKTELNGKITEANGKISALDTRLTKQASDNKADITQLKANLNTTNSVLLTHKEQADKKFDNIKVEQSDQDTLISDILNAFSAESDKGTNLKLNTSATKVLGVSIYGNLEQNKYTGKNIIDHLRFSSLYGSRTNTNTGMIVKRGGSDKPTIGVYSLNHNASVRMWSFIVSQTDVVLSFSVRSLTSQKLNFVYRLEPLEYNNLQLTTSWQKVVYKVPKSNANNFAAFIFYATNLDMTDPNCGFEIKDVQIEAGTEATDYEPFVGSTLPNGYSNLFDEFSNLPIQKNDISLTNQNGSLKLSGKPNADWVPLLFRDLNGLLDKTTYTVVAYNQNTTQIFAEIMMYKKDGSGIDKNTAKGQRAFTFTTDNAKYNRYAMKLGLGPASEFSEPVTIYNNYALFVGNYTEDNLPEYSPFNTPLTSPRPQLPQVVKELSSGKVQTATKNLFYPTSRGSSPEFYTNIEEDGSITFGGKVSSWWGDNLAVQSNIYFEAGKQMVLSIDKPLPFDLILALWSNDGRITAQEPKIPKGRTSAVFTLRDDAIKAYPFISINNTGWGQNTAIPNINIKIQVEYGSTATTYIKHESSKLTIPTGLNIYKLTDDIYDEIRLENGVAKLIKRVGKLVLTGEENNFDLYRTTNSGTLGFRYYDSSRPFTQQQMISNIICSHFESIDENRVYQSIHNKTGVSIYNSFDTWPSYADKLCFWFTAPDALNLKITDVASFKNWLKSEQAKGTPVTVYYEMKAPTEEKITDPAILTQLNKLMEARTYDGLTNISVAGDSLAPEIKVKYMRKIN